MFDDGTGRAVGGVKFRHKLKSCIGIIDIVVGKLLALYLLRSCDTLTQWPANIKSGLLVRVFAIAQTLLQMPAKRAKCRCFDLKLGGHPIGNFRVISCRTRIGFLRQPLPQCELRALMGLEAVQHVGVIFRVNNHRDVLVIFGCRADHGRAANINVFNTRLVSPTAPDRLLKRVEIDHQQIDRANTMVAHGVCMGFIIAYRKQSAMHHRVQCFHPPVHHFGEAGQLRHIAAIYTRLREHFCRAAGGDDFDFLRHQLLCEIDNAGFVRNGYQGAGNGFKR